MTMNKKCKKCINEIEHDVCEVKSETRVLHKSVWHCEGKREMTYWPKIIGVNV